MDRRAAICYTSRHLLVPCRGGVLTHHACGRADFQSLTADINSMTHWTEYHTPTSVAEALTLLEQYGNDAALVAGGTDLLLDLQYNGHGPVHALVDVTAIDGLNTIRDEGDSLVIGAAVTHAQIERDPRLRAQATALVESCSVVGGPQVRNVATIGGNVAHALPAADGTIGLLALNADVQVCTLTGGVLDCAWQPLLSIFAGPGRNNLAKNQILFTDSWGAGHELKRMAMLDAYDSGMCDITTANLKANTFGSVGIDKLTESPFASVIMNGGR